MLALQARRDVKTDAPCLWMQALAQPATDRTGFAVEIADALAIFAHDLRGPLANLALLIEAIGAEAQAVGSVRTIERTARAERIIDRLDGMLGAMLERARDSGNVLVARRKPVDMADVVETVATLNRPLAEKRGVRLHCFVAEPLVASGDAHLLMQAVDNLVGNAIAFTPAGGLVLCEAAPADNGDVLIRITDEGPGLAPEDIARAFRIFTPLSSRPAAPRKSTGLGLSIVRRIAEAHGGSVKAASPERGKGSSFTLRLPAQAD